MGKVKVEGTRYATRREAVEAAYDVPVEGAADVEYIAIAIGGEYYTVTDWESRRLETAGHAYALLSMRQTPRSACPIVSVPVNSDRTDEPEPIDEADLLAAVKDNFSPEAATAMAFALRQTATNNSSVNRQLAWFADRLVELVSQAAFDANVEALAL